MADVFGHGLVLLKLLEEDVLVEAEDVLEVPEDDLLFALERGRDVGGLGHGLEEAVDAELEVLHVRPLSLQELGHDEPAIRRTCSVSRFAKTKTPSANVQNNLDLTT